MPHQFYSVFIPYAREDKLTQDVAGLIDLLRTNSLSETTGKNSPVKNSPVIYKPIKVFEAPEGGLYLILMEQGPYQKDFIAIGEQPQVEGLVKTLREFYTQRGYATMGELLSPEEQAARLRTPAGDFESGVF